MPQGRILIIDDDPEWVEILSGFLASFEEQGVLVDSASSRPEAKRKLDRQRFDLVTMDIQLDRCSDSAEGTEEEVGTKEELKWLLLLRKCLSKQTRVIVVSGYSTMERVKTAFRDYKVHDFFAKQTLKPEEFIKAVEEALQEAGAVGSEGEESIRAKSLRKQLDERQRNLNKLEEQKATFAKGEEPLRLLNQIEAEEREIARLEAELSEFKKEPDHADSD
jgi:DNA-binding NtrC family response regulator